MVDRLIFDCLKLFIDLILRPVNFVSDPIRGPGNYLVMCEVFNPDGTPHSTNGRARLRAALANGGAEQDPWIGFEQEYTLFADGRPLGFPAEGEPAPQGPYYCSVGSDVAFGREVSEAHARTSFSSGGMHRNDIQVDGPRCSHLLAARGKHADRRYPLYVAFRW